MFLVNGEHFKTITGIDFDTFSNRILNGDGWGNFLKIASIIETSTKKAIGLKLGLETENKYIYKLEFMNTVHLCFDLKIISKEARDFVIKLIEVRNKLIHTNGQLTFNIKELLGEMFYERYKKDLNSYISVENISIESGEIKHLSILVSACIGFVGEISKFFYNDDWYNEALELTKK